MKFARKISRVFGLHKTTNLPNEEQSEFSLAHLGYPSLYQVSFFLTIEGLKLWKDKKDINFPDKCCYCGRATSVMLPSCPEMTSIFFKRPKTILNAVPHCEEHGDKKRTRLISSVAQWTGTVVQVSLTGANLSFLFETRNMNQSGDVIPPWEAFLQYDTVTGAWRQGDGEYWWKKVWLPYWDNLPLSKRQAYLISHSASDEWIEYMGKI